MTNEARDMAAFARAAEALEPYLSDLVFVGGLAHFLHTLRLGLIRVFAGLWTVATAFAFMIGFHERAAGLTGTLAVFLIVSHALVPWHAAGWVLAEVAWGSAAALCAVGLRHAGWGLLLAIVPTILLAIMLVSRKRYLGRLRGEPNAEPNMPVTSTLPMPGPCARADIIGG